MPSAEGSRSVRISAPAALAEIPKVKLILDSVRGFLGAPVAPSP